MKYEFFCSMCGKRVVVYRASFQSVPKYCSNECKFKGQIGKKIKEHITRQFTCDYCGKQNERYEPPELINKHRLRFCGKECQNKYQVGRQNPNFKEWRRKVKGGYISIYSPEHPHNDYYGCVYEHRIMMENKLGRILEENEIVHHINGIRDDNRIDNLKLCDSQSKHMKLHREISGGDRYESI